MVGLPLVAFVGREATEVGIDNSTVMCSHLYIVLHFLFIYFVYIILTYSCKDCISIYDMHTFSDIFFSLLCECSLVI